MFAHLNNDDNPIIQNILEHAEIEETISRIAIRFTISSVHFAENVMTENTKSRRNKRN